MKQIISISVAIFLAELGDKTQLATVAFGSKYGWEKASLGAILGFALITIIGAVLGEKIGHLFPQSIVKKLAGTVFIIIGILTLIERE